MINNITLATYRVKGLFGLWFQRVQSLWCWGKVTVNSRHGDWRKDEDSHLKLQAWNMESDGKVTDLYTL